MSPTVDSKAVTSLCGPAMAATTTAKNGSGNAHTCSAQPKTSSRKLSLFPISSPCSNELVRLSSLLVNATGSQTKLSSTMTRARPKAPTQRHRRREKHGAIAPGLRLPLHKNSGPTAITHSAREPPAKPLPHHVTATPSQPRGLPAYRRQAVTPSTFHTSQPKTASRTPATPSTTVVWQHTTESINAWVAARGSISALLISMREKARRTASS